MIAPAQRSAEKPARSTRALDEARRMIAATMLKERSGGKSAGQPIPPWQVWLFAVWTIAVAGSLAFGLHAWWQFSVY